MTGLDKLINPNLHSSIDFLLHVTAYVLQFVDALRKHVNFEGRDCSSKAVTTYEIDKLEMVWIQAVQQSFLERESNCS